MKHFAPALVFSVGCFLLSYKPVVIHLCDYECLKCNRMDACEKNNSTEQTFTKVPF